MINSIKESLWRQFGAGIDMLKNAIIACSDDYWNLNKRFFYTAYHTTLYLDYYLTVAPSRFSPALPYTLKAPADIPEEALDDAVPDRYYSRTEVLDYLMACREKCHTLLSGMTEEKMTGPRFGQPAQIDMELSNTLALKYSVFEILLYNLRHVQHHAAQLNQLLRQDTGDAPSWVSQTDTAD